MLRNSTKFKLLAILAVLFIVGAARCEAQETAQARATTDRRPNIVLINLDDCDVDLVSEKRLAFYPSLKKLASESIRFTNCHVTTPLCGPSRACLFRCQYAHNTGYRTNRANLKEGSGFTGGTAFFQNSGLADDQLPVWMQQAGYHTMLVGKYYQGDTDYVPVPGWDKFRAWSGNSYVNANRIEIWPEGLHSKRPVLGYRTELETKDVVELLEEYSADVDQQKPFFLYLAPVAPHVGPRNEDPVPDKWRDRFANVTLPNGPSFNEVDVSDKPVVYRDTNPLIDSELEHIRVAQRRRLIAMLGIDEMIDNVRRKIEEIGQSENTVLIMTSDHGYLLGQHRMHGKSFPLVEATNVPLWIHWPEKAKPRDVDSLLAHIDITATVVDLGQAKLPGFADGLSFASLIQDQSNHDPTAIRQSVLVENWESRLNSMSKQKVIYSSMIKPDSMYTEWATGEREFYDLTNDPQQLQNAYRSLNGSEKSSLEAELHSLRQNATTSEGTTASLSFPTVAGKFIGPAVELEGFAESGTTVSPVTVSIKRNSTGAYWDGSQWVSELITLPTDTPIGSGLLHEWSASPNLAGIQAGETLTIELHSADLNTTGASISRMEVEYDNQPPTVRVNRPRDQFVYPELSNFGGSIEDDNAVIDVRIFVRNLESAEYFDGESWSSEKTSLAVLVNPKRGFWHAKYPALEEGRYEVTAIGKDAAGNWSEPSAPSRIIVDHSYVKRRKSAEKIE